jgi:hypothetical protein
LQDRKPTSSGRIKSNGRDKEARYGNAIAFLLKAYTSSHSYIPRRTKVESKKQSRGRGVFCSPGWYNQQWNCVSKFA